MEWEYLLNSERTRKSSKREDDSRSNFECDYDRIIYSSAFRRLQDKAQVFSLEKQDYVRTRLTHTLEVACLGRSLGKDTAEKLEKNGMAYFTDKRNDCVKYDLAAIVSSACLVHDIGNPPFGHFGEYAIQKWFENKLNQKEKYMLDMDDNQTLDLLRFEGNAQSFRILTKLQYLIDENGLNLTFATLASILKYPRLSDDIYKLKGKKVEHIFTKDELENKVSFKKHGCFQSEIPALKNIIEKTGIGNVRHPLALLVEAADDIANSAADIEDAFKKKAISYDQIYNSFKKTFSENHSILNYMNKCNKESTEANYPEIEASVIQRLRALLQGEMLRGCVDVYINNYESIINSNYDCDLISHSNENSKKIYEILINLACKNVYCNNDVISLELVGYKVINGLLDIFVPAILSDDCKEINTAMGKYYKLISPNFEFIMNTYSNSNTYNKLLLATDFICGMTDSFALDLYQKLTGYKLN